MSNKNKNKEIASLIEALILKNFKTILDSETPIDIPAATYNIMLKAIEKYDLDDEEFDELVASVIDQESKDELLGEVKKLLNH
jgi:hypothetical protein